MNAHAGNLSSEDLADLLAVHLHDEKAVLEAALPMLRAVKAALTEPGGDALTGVIEPQHAIANLLDQIKVRRERFRGLIVRRCPDVADITVSKILQRVPARRRDALVPLADAVRRLTEEYVAISRWLSIHVRIHLDAYQRLLCDLTGSSQPSGRYGPSGTAEAGDFRPLLTIRG